MARSGVLLEALTSYYSNLGFNATAAMRATQEDLRTDSFSLSKTTGRALSLWMDAAEGWWSALLVSASAPVPTLFLHIVGDQTRTEPACVLVPRGGQLQLTALERLGGGDPIPKDYISVQPTSDRNSVELRLTNLEELRKLHRGRIPSGLYQGLVHVGQAPIAIIMVHVDDPAPAKSGSAKVNRRAVKRRATGKKKP